MKFHEVVTVAHNFKEDERTSDVKVDGSVDFGSFLLSTAVKDGLARAGFKKPSPIQLKAIPVGRLGIDMVVQAKSGTGKTCVFSVLALETTVLQNPATQVLILAPTREISSQICSTLHSIGVLLKPGGLHVGLFIGGTSLNLDRLQLRSRCHIVVGTPGRLCQLVQLGYLKLDGVRLFCLDEADKLMDDSYRDNVDLLFSKLPPSKQVAVFSATFPHQLDSFLSRYMRSPTMVRLDETDIQLVGIKQYLVKVFPVCQPVDWLDAKVHCLHRLLCKVRYTQCLVFCNSQQHVQRVHQSLQRLGHSALFISATLEQEQRLKVLKCLQLFQVRLVVSTDLTARGVNAPLVDLVVNLEAPYRVDTYFHRIGRAGRFGGYGAALTLISDTVDDGRFFHMGNSAGFHMRWLPDCQTAPQDLCTNETFWDSNIHVDFKMETMSKDLIANLSLVKPKHELQHVNVNNGLPEVAEPKLMNDQLEENAENEAIVMTTTNLPHSEFYYCPIVSTEQDEQKSRQLLVDDHHPELSTTTARSRPLLASRKSSRDWLATMDRMARILGGARQQLRSSVETQLSIARNNNNNNRTVRYTYDQALSVWEQVVALDYDPRLLSWHANLCHLGLFLPRVYKLDSDLGSSGHCSATNQPLDMEHLSNGASQTPPPMGQQTKHESPANGCHQPANDNSCQQLPPSLAQCHRSMSEYLDHMTNAKYNHWQYVVD